MSILWPPLVAALWPLDLATLLQRLPHILVRLEALDATVDPTDPDDRSRPKQVARFRTWFMHELRAA